jgi:hypothetical protein
MWFAVKQRSLRSVLIAGASVVLLATGVRGELLGESEAAMLSASYV